MIGFFSKKKLLLLIFLIKFIYIIFAVFVYTKLSSLGDTYRYLNSKLYFPNLNSTALMDFSGYFANKLPLVLKHFPLMILSFIGIKYLLGVLQKYHLCNTSRDRLFFFLLFCMPSIGIWSSIHSKEAVGVFFMSIITAFIIKVNIKKRIFPNLIEIFALTLCYIFKPHYLISIFSTYLFILISRQFKLSNILQTCIFLFAIITQLLILYSFQDKIDNLAFQMHTHFDSPTANSTRDNIFFEPGDFFKNSSYGMLIAFLGPTFEEASRSPAKLLAFLESLIYIVSIYFYSLLSFKNIIKGKFNIFSFSVLFLAFFWILFVHYPFGVFNPGSAIRYRSNFLPFFIGLLLMTANYKGNIIQLHSPSRT